MLVIDIRRVGRNYLDVKFIFDSGDTSISCGFLDPKECRELAETLRDAADELDPQYEIEKG